MNDQFDDEVPACYGKLEVVFPKGGDGLRHSPDSCMPCFFKTRCLRTAMEGSEGLQVEEERTDRAYESGLIGFFERWSRKKELSRKIQKKNAAK